MGAAEIIAFIIAEEPAAQALILSIIQQIKDNRAGIVTAEKATDAAHAALAQLLSRQADPVAQDAADLAAVTAEMEQKVKGE